MAGAAVFGVQRFLRAGVPTERGPVPRFQASSLEHVYDGEFQFFVGGGVAVFDCNDDGFPELFLAGGSNPSGLFRNQSSVGGELAFQPIPGPTNTAVTGAYPIDIDSDRVTDLVVLRAGSNELWHGTGDCLFEPANETWNIDGGDDWTVAFSAAWEPGSEFPSLAFGNYLVLGPDQEREGCADHQLYRPVGRTYGDAEELSPGWCTLSMLFSDWDRSGRRDLRMTNDRHYYRDGEEQLWRIEPGQPPRLYTQAEGWQPMRIWGMGIASHDLTADGRPEVFLTSQSDNKLQTLVASAPGPEYDDIAFQLGTTVHRPFAGDVNLPSTAWHPEFDDVNNDALVDLFVSKGNVEAQPEYAALDPNNLLLGNIDGTFTEVAEEAGILDFARSRGAAVVDLNLDGALDLVVVERRQPVTIWRNLGTEGNWIHLRLRQEGANPDGIGAFVKVRAGRHEQEKEVTIGGGHASGQLGWIHFGLGDASSAEVRVQWPDGRLGPWMRMDANTFALVGPIELEQWVP